MNRHPAGLLILAIVSVGGVLASAVIPTMPLQAPFEDTIRQRWLNKPVLDNRLLDDMEDLGHWSHHGFGRMELTQQRAQHGSSSLRLTSPTKGEKPGPTLGRPFGAAVVQRNFDGEDWSDFNRLSFWVFPTLPGFRVISLCVVLRNDGQEKVPGPYGRNGRNFVLLEPDCWNHIVWEITHLGRDKVTGVEFSYRLQGNEPGATETVTYDIDQLELQKVEPDHFEGWNVAPGRIAYCHAGYALNGAKTALAGDPPAGRFAVVDADTNQAVFIAPVRTLGTATGTFHLLDFSDVNRAGRYRLRVGEIETPSFMIGEDVWRDSIAKTVNFFNCERCGTAIPGIHDVCHSDWRVRSGDKEIVINGGWHDAGDLSQGLVNTSEAVYAMFALSRHLRERQPELAERLIEEGRWGLDWVLKTRFGDGHRCTWATMDFWTDGILGTVDDVTVGARHRPFENYLAASAEALAARTLKSHDGVRAAYCLQAAKEDWDFAYEATRQPDLELAAAAMQSSLDLYEATGESSYADEAFGFARMVLECQQQRIPGWDVPLTGFFYHDRGKERVLHYSHRGHEQAPVIGLTRLCRMFPGHTEWMDWYAAVALYSEYYHAIAEYNAPYYMLPASIYHVDESRRDTYRDQVENGIRLSEDYYLRRFPVWYDFRGNHGTVLSQTKGLATAARLRGDSALLELCTRQIEWVLGRNPFCQSTMYGLGHDYAPQYTAMSGDMVGSLPVGVQTHFERDVPYWPADNCYNWKEVWVHPSSRWLWLMCDLHPAAPVPDAGYVLSEETAGDGDVTITLKATTMRDTRFDIMGWNLDEASLRKQQRRMPAAGEIIMWETRILDPAKPWVAVVMPEGDLGRSRDIVGNFPSGR